jgi:hypothetical protein
VKIYVILIFASCIEEEYQEENRGCFYLSECALVERRGTNLKICSPHNQAEQQVSEISIDEQEMRLA